MWRWGDRHRRTPGVYGDRALSAPGAWGLGARLRVTMNHDQVSRGVHGSTRRVIARAIYPLPQGGQVTGNVRWADKFLADRAGLKAGGLGLSYRKPALFMGG